MEQTRDFQAPVRYRRFQIGCVFVENDLFNTTTFIQNCLYMNFRINLTQFYINFSRQDHQIEVLKVSFNAWDSQVSFHTTFHFSLPVPLSWVPSAVNFQKFWMVYNYLQLQKRFRSPLWIQIFPEKIGNPNFYILYTLYSLLYIHYML